MEVSHVVRSVHTRLEVVVGAVDWYWVALHVVSAVHTRWEVVVGAVDCHSVPRHAVQAVQSAAPPALK